MIIKEDVLNVIQNIINEPIKHDGGSSKEIRILKAVEEMEEYRDDVVTCDRCAFHQDGVCVCISMVAFIQMIIVVLRLLRNERMQT